MFIVQKSMKANIYPYIAMVKQYYYIWAVHKRRVLEGELKV